MLNFNLLGEKIANFLGDSKDYGETCLRRVKSIAATLEHEPIASLMPYQTYDETRRLFLNKESVGFSLELLPLTGIDEEGIERIVSMLNDKLPDDGSLHVQLFASNKIGAIIDAFVKVRGQNNPIIKSIAKMRAAFFAKSTQDSISKHMPFYARNYHVYLHYAEPIKNYATELQFEEIDRLRSAWKTSLSSLTKVNDLTLCPMLALLREFANPTESIYWSDRPYNDYESISTQVGSVATDYNIEPDKVEINSDNEYCVQSYFAESLPEKFALWQMSDSIGRTFEVSQQLPCPTIINLHLRALSKQVSQEKANAEFMMNDSKAHSPLARLVPAIRKKHEEWTFLREHLNGSERLCQVYFTVTTISRKERAQSDAVQLIDLYNSLGFRLRSDKYLQLAGFLANFPYTMTAGLYDDLRYFERFKTVTVFNAVNLMPLLADWKGNPKSAGLIFTSRRGQLCNFAPHDNKEGNYNMAVAAKPRSGKSVVSQEILIDMLLRGGIVRILDIGGSFHKTVEMLGGASIKFDESLCINMFSNIKDFTESATQIETLFATMVHPNGEASDIEKSLLSQAIAMAWEAKGNDATVTTVVSKLEELTNPVANTLVLLLSKYAVGGKYARYFEGKCSVDLTNPLVEVDLEPVKDKPDLKSALVMSMILQINEEFYDPSNEGRKRPKLCIIDEAWDLLHSSKEAAKFIEAGYRRVAKHNGAFMTIAQGVKDYFRNEMAQTAYECSDYQFILAQKQESIDAAVENKLLNLSPYEERLLRSISGTNQYREGLIRTPNGSALVRILFEPFSRILFSSRAEHVTAVDCYRKLGMDLETAVDRVAREEFPDEY